MSCRDKAQAESAFKSGCEIGADEGAHGLGFAFQDLDGVQRFCAIGRINGLGGGGHVAHAKSSHASGCTFDSMGNFAPALGITLIPNTVQLCHHIGDLTIEQTENFSVQHFVAAGVAAAAIVLIGIGTVLAYSQGSKTSPIVASAILRPIDSPASSSGSITAVAIGDTRRPTVHTERLAALPVEEFYEVWLLGPATQKMLPVGVLPPSWFGTNSIGASIMADYSAVDLSLQSNYGNPAHSNTSVRHASFFLRVDLLRRSSSRDSDSPIKACCKIAVCDSTDELRPN